MMRKTTITLLIAMTLGLNPSLPAPPAPRRGGGGRDLSINIWEGTECGHVVELTPYLAEERGERREERGGKGNAAVVVCPGGSYFWHDMQTEGHEVARWLQSNGLSAFVLRYRTAYVPAFVLRYRYVLRGNRYPDAQDDLRQTLAYLRRHAEELGIDTARIGVMGFSAGGHLAMSAAELLPVAERPGFVAAIYPVVTMNGQYVHKRSRRALLGESRVRNQRLRDSLSLERHVPKDCPPVFLVNCKDDPVVDYHNSVLLDSALCAQGVAHKYLQYATGGHGFGASTTKGTAESREWMNAFLQWIKGLG